MGVCAHFSQVKCIHAVRLTGERENDGDDSNNDNNDDNDNDNDSDDDNKNNLITFLILGEVGGR